jgi:hypothetical protein
MAVPPLGSFITHSNTDQLLSMVELCQTPAWLVV